MIYTNQIIPPTDQKSVGGIIWFLDIKFCLLVGETCGLPRANTVRPYRALDKLPYEKEPLGACFFCMILPKAAKTVKNAYRLGGYYEKHVVGG